MKQKLGSGLLQLNSDRMYDHESLADFPDFGINDHSDNNHGNERIKRKRRRRGWKERKI